MSQTFPFLELTDMGADSLQQSLVPNVCGTVLKEWNLDHDDP